MNINPDDPKWTAYVLGELNDAERVQVEKELESSAIAREVVEEIRLATDLLKHEFTQEQAVGLAPDQRRVITSVAEARQRVRPMFRWAGVAASVASGLLIVATLSVLSPQRSREASPVPLTAIAPVSEAQPAESERDHRRSTDTAIGRREKIESAGKDSQIAATQQGGQTLQ